MCGATIKWVSLLVLIFEQGAAPANNSTTLCVTIVGFDRIFNCGHVGKRPSCGRGEQTFEKCFWTKIYSQETWWRQPEKHCQRHNEPRNLATTCISCKFGHQMAPLALGAVHILRQPPEGGEGVWQMLTIADKGRWGQKNVRKREIMGTENVDKENNWFKSNCIC